MPFVVAGAPHAIENNNNSRAVVNDKNVDAIEDALRRLEITVSPCSTTTSERTTRKKVTTGCGAMAPDVSAVNL